MRDIMVKFILINLVLKGDIKITKELIEKEKIKRIAVDVDGTLTKEGQFPQIWGMTIKDLYNFYESVEPNVGMIEWVNKMYDKGFVIFLFTSRSDLTQAQLKSWLKKHKVKYHFYVMGKPYYDIIVDDKAINVDDKAKLNNLLLEGVV